MYVCIIYVCMYVCMYNICIYTTSHTHAHAVLGEPRHEVTTSHHSSSALHDIR